MRGLPGSLVTDALAIATIAHAGQVDKAGRPYIEHPLRVARRVMETGGPQPVVAAALLHDVVEDTGLTHEALAESLKWGRKTATTTSMHEGGWGTALVTLGLVEALTHRQDETRDDYYERIKAAGPNALAIKRFDMADNLDRDRLRAVSRTGEPITVSPSRPPGAKTVQRLIRKYEHACEVLGLDIDEVAGYDVDVFYDSMDRAVFW
jgi:hypothetical protein